MSNPTYSVPKAARPLPFGSASVWISEYRRAMAAATAAERLSRTISRAQMLKSAYR